MIKPSNEINLFIFEHTLKDKVIASFALFLLLGSLGMQLRLGFLEQFKNNLFRGSVILFPLAGGVSAVVCKKLYHGPVTSLERKITLPKMEHHPISIPPDFKADEFVHHLIKHVFEARNNDLVRQLVVRKKLEAGSLTYSNVQNQQIGGEVKALLQKVNKMNDKECLQEIRRWSRTYTLPEGTAAKNPQENQKKNEAEYAKYGKSKKEVHAKLSLLRKLSRRSEGELEALIAELRNAPPSDGVPTCGYSQIRDNGTFATLLKMDLSKMNHPAHEYKPGWFAFQNQEYAYIDFANRAIFGGGFRLRHGAVQEETLFFEFLRLRLLDYLSSNNGRSTIHPVSGGRPAPFVINAGRRGVVCGPALYGRSLNKINPKEIPNHLSDPNQAEQEALIIGIAAHDFSTFNNETREYTPEILQEHLEAFYLTCVAAREAGKVAVATAPWGCGAFDNKEKTMVTIMLLAAKMAGMPLIFHGIGNHNEEYSQAMVEEQTAFINQFNTPEAVLHYLANPTRGNLSADEWERLKESYAPKYKEIVIDTIVPYEGNSIWLDNKQMLHIPHSFSPDVIQKHLMERLHLPERSITIKQQEGGNFSIGIRSPLSRIQRKLRKTIVL